MSKRINDLYQEIQSLYNQDKKLRKAVEEGERLLTADEETQHKKLMDEMLTIQKTIDFLKEGEEDERNLAAPTFNGKGEQTGTVEELNKKAADVTDKWLKFGPNKLTKEEKAVIGLQADNTESRIEIRATAGIANPTYGVDTELITAIDAATKWYGGWWDACTVITSKTGRSMTWPYFDDTAVTGAIEAEGTYAIDSGTAITLEQMTLGAYPYSSLGLVIGEFELADYDVPLSQIIYEPLATRLLRAESTATTTGSGSSQPDGIVTNAGVGEIVSASTTPTRTDISNLIQDVDYSYHHKPKSGFMLHANTLYKLAQLTVGSADARPLWVPSMREGVPSTIEGFKYWINNDMDEVGANKKVLLFGDFSKHVIRKVGTPYLVRLDERYREKMQIGFIMLHRIDSDSLQPSDTIKYARCLGT